VVQVACIALLKIEVPFKIPTQNGRDTPARDPFSTLMEMTLQSHALCALSRVHFGNNSAPIHT
jgi:hypothetical protein